MDEKELLRRAEAYAKEIYADCDLSDIGVQDEINALALNCMCFAKVLMEDYCIVEKSKIIENYQSLKRDIPKLENDPKRHLGFLGGMTELELLFGKKLFTDTEQ